MAVANSEQIVIGGLALYKLREEHDNTGIMLVKVLRTDFCKEKQVPDSWKPGMPWCVRFALLVASLPYKAEEFPKVLRKCVSAIGATELRERWEAAGGQVLRGEVSRGAVFLLYDKSGDEYHAGICLGQSEVFPNLMICLEGNSNPVGSPEGFEVSVRLRKIEDCAVLVY